MYCDLPLDKSETIFLDTTFAPVLEHLQGALGGQYYLKHSLQTKSGDIDAPATCTVVTRIRQERGLFYRTMAEAELHVERGPGADGESPRVYVSSEFPKLEAITADAVARALPDIKDFFYNRDRIRCHDHPADGW